MAVLYPIEVILPLVIAALIIPFMEESPKKVKYLALGASLLTLLITLSLIAYPPTSQIQSFSWFRISGYNFDIATSTAPLNMFLLVIVSIIGPLIFLYSMGYMEIPSEQRRFYFEMCIFAASMMLFAISASLITLFIAWEMLGVTSYLLIGFWYRREFASHAARKAITTILLGDIAMLAGIVIIAVNVGSFDYSAILSNISGPGPLVLPALLILIAAFTKSAQFPFHEWLSDAMEGPTPVSAFLHSSTMVKAGVFLIITLVPLYIQTGLQSLILVVGLLSAIVGASNALTSKHIKKILAYSTIEDLGLMFVAVGLNAIYAGVLFFFVQSFYKALLFMGAGSIMHANGDEEDIFKTYNSTTRKSIFIPIAIGVLSIAGVFPLSGFFGKALIGNAASSNPIVYLVLVLVEIASSTYAFRWLFIPMRHMNFEDEELEPPNYKAVPMAMVVPMLVLAVLVFAADAGYFLLPQYLGGYIPIVGQSVTVTEFLAVNAVALIGFYSAYRIYRKNHRFYLSSTNQGLYTLLYNNVITNRVYDYIGKSTFRLAESLSKLDYTIDRATYSFSDALIKSGYAVKGMVDGQVNTYLLAFVAGFAILVLMFVL